MHGTSSRPTASRITFDYVDFAFCFIYTNNYTNMVNCAWSYFSIVIARKEHKVAFMGCMVGVAFIPVGFACGRILKPLSLV